MNLILPEEIKQIQQEDRPPDPGCYALPANSIYWIRCREEFAHQFLFNTKSIIFSHKKGYEYTFRVASFMNLVEEIIELPQKSDYYKCNLKFATWISPNNFWLTCPIRRSLYTILLRCSLKFDPDERNFDEALESNSYARETKLAIYRFLFGFTEFSGKLSEGGWRNVFRKKTQEELRCILNLPSDKKIESSIVGTGSLWN